MSDLQEVIEKIAAIPPDYKIFWSGEENGIQLIGSSDDLKAIVSALGEAREDLGLARVRINRLAHVISRDQPALWNGTQLGPATESDVKEIGTTLAKLADEKEN